MDPAASDIRPHVDEADDEVIRLDPESALHCIVVRGLTGSPHRTQSLGDGGQHDGVSGTTGRNNLLDDRDLRGPIASRRDHDDEWRAQSLLPLLVERRFGLACDGLLGLDLGDVLFDFGRSVFLLSYGLLLLS